MSIPRGPISSYGGGRRLSLDARGQALGEVADHVLVVALERAAADLEELRVAPELLDLVLRDVAVAAVDLDRGVGDVLGDGRRLQDTMSRSSLETSDSGGREELDLSLIHI